MECHDAPATTGEHRSAPLGVTHEAAAYGTDDAADPERTLKLGHRAASVVCATIASAPARLARA